LQNSLLQCLCNVVRSASHKASVERRCSTIQVFDQPAMKMGLR
jgi:hypothetical protein